MQVFLAILLCGDGQRTETVGQKIDDGELQFRKEVLQLGGPLNADEARAGNLIFFLTDPLGTKVRNHILYPLADRVP